MQFWFAKFLIYRVNLGGDIAFSVAQLVVAVPIFKRKYRISLEEFVRKTKVEFTRFGRHLVYVNKRRYTALTRCAVIGRWIFDNNSSSMKEI